MADAELVAMTQIGDALSELDDNAKVRVLSWAISRYGSDRMGERENSIRNATLGATEESKYADVANLFFTAAPETEAEKVLTVGYWLQVINGAESLDAQQVNGQLKHMGHGASNITRAFENLIDRKPQFAIQTHKSGSGKQARKKYRLTTAGIKRMEEMLRGDSK